MGGMQRRKGAAGEREACHELIRAGMLARRTAQYCGNTGDAADIHVEGLGVHVEIKRTEKLRIYDAIEQAKRDAKGARFIVLHRTNMKPWIVIQLLEHWVDDSEAAQGAIAHRQDLIAKAAAEINADDSQF
jgi:Holliday junction resolvase